MPPLFDLVAVLRALRLKSNKFQRYSFLLDAKSSVRRVPDSSGRWVEADAVSELLDETCTDWLEKELGPPPTVRPLFDRFGILLDDVSNFLDEQAQEARERGQDCAAAGREAQSFALRDLLRHLIAGHHVPSANGEAVFWYRPRSDGLGWDGPLHDSNIEDVRKRSGVWVPLYAGKAPAPLPPRPWPELLPLLNDYAMAVNDAANHQAASKVDISKTQAVKALGKLRAAIYGDEKKYGEVRL